MKEEVAQESLGFSEENGSMYSLLVNFFQEEITKNRAYVLANELAKVKGEAFEMPERSTKYGVFVDNPVSYTHLGCYITSRTKEREQKEQKMPKTESEFSESFSLNQIK